MKRSVATSVINSEESDNNHCNHKKRKLNDLKRKNASSNEINVQPQFRRTQESSSDCAISRLPVSLNGLTQERSSWNPQWGYQNSWATPRNNLNYHCFDIQQSSSVPSSSNHCPHPSKTNDIVPQRNRVNPISFFSLESKFVPKIPPDTAIKCKDTKLENVSKDILVHFTTYKQNEKIYHQKVELWNELDRVLKRRFRCATHVFGSTLNGFGSHESDMDLCMFNGVVNSKKGKDDVRLLAEVRRAIRYLI